MLLARWRSRWAVPLFHATRFTCPCAAPTFVPFHAILWPSSSCCSRDHRYLLLVVRLIGTQHSMFGRVVYGVMRGRCHAQQALSASPNLRCREITMRFVSVKSVWPKRLRDRARLESRSTARSNRHPVFCNRVTPPPNARNRHPPDLTRERGIQGNRDRHPFQWEGTPPHPTIA